ncbi:S-adenosyl-L-methionine-dependent methyltransferase [Thozetella sp. PMI_491]|nr:S-adenosyl-L-methionine-dependent methyltransferase [Thozetella sp. PMI_491]
MSATTSISESFRPGPDDDLAKIEGIHEPGPGIGFLEVDDDEDGESAALYPMSTYPRMTPAYRVERPYSPGDGPDTRTMHVSPGPDSSRTLYAEDIDYVLENGRWYCGDYYMPIDEDEKIRQYVIHNVYLQFFHGELTTVPLNNPKYILDIGTGIGEWAIGMAERYPDCEVFGSDIAPIQETQVPSNVEFQIETAEDEWIRPANTVDLVHLRNMAGAFRDWTFIYSQAFKCIKPDGWIEVVDFDDHQAYQNFLSHYPNNSPLHLISNGLQEASALSGRPRGTAHLDPQLLIDAGFVDIKESAFTLYLGEHMSTSYGTLWMTACISGIEATCLRLLTRQLGWDPADVLDLCKSVEVETKRMASDPARAAGFGVRLRVLVGRKPAQPGQWAAQALNENGEIASMSDGGDGSTVGSRSVLTATSGSTI